MKGWHSYVDCSLRSEHAWGERGVQRSYGLCFTFQVHGLDIDMVYSLDCLSAKSQNKPEDTVDVDAKLHIFWCFFVQLYMDS